MLLQRLKEYADKCMELPPQLYSETAVRYIIELVADGRFVGLIDTLDPGNSKTKRGQTFWMPRSRDIRYQATIDHRQAGLCA